MKIAYFDCVAGASGDMLLGALLDTGLPEEVLRGMLAGLGLPGFDLRVRRVMKNGIGATKVDVIVDDQAPERHLTDLVEVVAQGALAPKVRDRAITVLTRLGEVEAGIHGVPVDAVHLHELGGLDTIVDVVGVLAGMDALGIEQVVVSPVPLGRGTIRTAHGEIPLPAPATLALLRGAPVTGSEIRSELVTPTGAALLTSLADAYGSIPAMTLTAVGYGAGGRDLPIPNVMRLLIGESAPAADVPPKVVSVIETNIDDLNPEVYEHVMSRLFKAGALDVFLTPIQMKKNRPATLLRVICRPADSGTMTNILFEETSTLGVRRHVMERETLPRTMLEVQTPYGIARVKTARLPDGRIKAAPEYEDCRRLAEAQGVPLRDVYLAAELAATTPPTDVA
jgi:uncharacterized protein (TIGR00299 family) protein